MRTKPLVTNEDIAAYDAAGLWQATTLWELVARHPADKPAIVCPRWGTVTYGEWRREAEGLAAAWYAEGLQPGEVVAYQLPNWYEVLLVHLALTRLGAISLGFLPNLVESDLGFLVNRSRTVGLVAAPDYPSTPDREVYDRLQDVDSPLRWVIDVHDSPDLRAVSASGDTAILPPPPHPDDVTILMPTSGTTGESKLVMHSHRSTVGGTLQSVASLMRLTPDDVMLMPSSVAHASGLQYGIRMAAYLGATLVLQDRWDPERCVELMAAHKVTWIMGATPFLFDLLQLDDATLSQAATLGIFVCGGAPIPESVAELATVRLPRVSLLAAWGMSETGIATLVRPGDPLSKVTGSDGAPVPGWEFRIANPDSDEPLPTGASGEIQCRGAALFHGYLGRPDFTEEAYRGGWLRTGDLGRFDADGYLRCLGRIKDLIIRGGVNISSAEIEDAVRTHPAVHHVAVIGTPDERLGERICAVIVPASGCSAPTVPELSEFLLAAGIARQKLPERVVALDALPVTMTGKIKKYELRAHLG